MKFEALCRNVFFEIAYLYSKYCVSNNTYLY